MLVCDILRMICHFEFKCHSISFHKQRKLSIKYQHLGIARVKFGTYLKYLADPNQAQTINASNLIQVKITSKSCKYLRTRFCKVLNLYSSLPNCKGGLMKCRSGKLFKFHKQWVVALIYTLEDSFSAK